MNSDGGHAFAWPGAVKAENTLSSQRSGMSFVHVLSPCASSQGLVVSRGNILQYCVIQAKISHQTLEPAVFLFKLLQTFCLATVQSSVFLPPTIIGLLSHTNLTCSPGYGLTFRRMDLDFSKQMNDLLRSVSFFVTIQVSRRIV